MPQQLRKGGYSCKHLGKRTGETVICGVCPKRISLEVHECSVFGQCTALGLADGMAGCQYCESYVSSQKSRPKNG